MEYRGLYVRTMVATKDEDTIARYSLERSPASLKAISPGPGLIFDAMYNDRTHVA